MTKENNITLPKSEDEKLLNDVMSSHLEAPDAWNISAIHLQKGKQMLH